MDVLRRILLILWSLFLVAIGLVAIGCLTHSGILYYWQNMLQSWIFNPYSFPVSVLIAIVFIVLGILGLIVALHFKRKDTLVSVSNAEYGQINISMQAIDSIVRKSVAAIEDVKDVQPKIKSVPEGVALYLKVTVPHDISVPEISLRLQKEVKTYLEAISGLKVQEIKVLVSNILGESHNKINFNPASAATVATNAAPTTSEISATTVEAASESDDTQKNPL
jgi:uncharacterized alkaline shock family protein YloU